MIAKKPALNIYLEQVWQHHTVVTKNTPVFSCAVLFVLSHGKNIKPAYFPN